MFHEAAAAALGKKRKGGRKPWLSEQTRELQEARRQAKTHRRDSSETSKHYNYLCRQIKKSLKSDKERYIMEACHGIEQDIRTNKIRSVYKVIRELTEDYAPKVNTV